MKTTLIMLTLSSLNIMKPVIAILFFALFFNAISCLAQYQTDVKLTPTPYDVTAYKGQSSNRSIKKRIWLTDFAVSKPDCRDTITITEYDRNGRIIHHISFLQGKRSSVTDYSYPQIGMTVWRSQSPGSRLADVCQIMYDKSGKVNYFNSISVVNNDTTARMLTRFIYNKDSLVLMREQSRGGKAFVTNTYQYKDKNMVMAEFKTAGSPYTAWIGMIYNKDHLPVKQNRYGLRGSVVDSSLLEAYTFAGKNLASVTRPDGSNLKSMVLSTFTYDEQGRIANETATQDTLYQRVSYAYQGKYLARITVIANITRSSLAHGYLLPYLTRLPIIPAEFVTTYAYDNKGYLIKTEETLNGILQLRKVYLIEYY
jgi:YD repeat-containing protein